MKPYNRGKNINGLPDITITRYNNGILVDGRDGNAMQMQC
jgi:hypothetical protein